MCVQVCVCVGVWVGECERERERESVLQEREREYERGRQSIRSLEVLYHPDGLKQDDRVISNLFSSQMTKFLSDLRQHLQAKEEYHITIFKSPLSVQHTQAILYSFHEVEGEKGDMRPTHPPTYLWSILQMFCDFKSQHRRCHIVSNFLVITKQFTIVQHLV